MAAPGKLKMLLVAAWTCAQRDYASMASSLDRCKDAEAKAINPIGNALVDSCIIISREASFAILRELKRVLKDIVLMPA